MHPTQQTLEFIREFLEVGGPSCAPFSDKKSLPLICYFVQPLIYCFLADFFFQLLCSLGFPYYNLVLVLFSASFSMYYLSQLDWAWHHLTSSLDYLRFLKIQQIK